MPSSVGDLFPYDSIEYLETLSHVGCPRSWTGGRGGFLQCPVPEACNLTDGMGAWPYSTPWAAERVGLIRRQLEDMNLVTFRAFFKPDSHIDAETFRQAGFEVHTLKEHFVLDPGPNTPEMSCKIRGNIRRGKRLWRVSPIPLADYLDLFLSYYQTLKKRRQFSHIAALPDEHFNKLLDLPGLTTLGAFDSRGLGAVLVGLRWQREIHFHALAGAERAYRSNGFFALYQGAIEHWGSGHTLYMGGAPAGPDGPGIARFKQRFSNRRAQVKMITLVVDPQAMNMLNTGSIRAAWFPPYRGISG